MQIDIKRFFHRRKTTEDALIPTQWVEKLNPMIFPRVLVLLSSGIMMPVTGPAPIAKENIYL